MAKKNPVDRTTFKDALPTPGPGPSASGTTALDGPAGPFGSLVIGVSHPSAPSTLLKRLGK